MILASCHHDLIRPFDELVSTHATAHATRRSTALPRDLAHANWPCRIQRMMDVARKASISIPDILLLSTYLTGIMHPQAWWAFMYV